MKWKWSQHQCRCESKGLDDWGSCKKGYIWSPSTCDCECDKKCKIDKYLDTKDCSCKKRLPVKLVLKYEDEILNTLKPYLTIK